MNKVIVFKNADGSVGVLNPSPQCHLTLEEIAAKDLPEGCVEYQIFDAESLPSDKTFRNAWALKDGQLEHDMDKARDLQKVRLRGLRAPLLSKLDVDYQKADEEDDRAKKKKIADKKKALRDITVHESILAASSVEELKQAGILELDNIINS